jgi:hypothetical protein
MKRQWCGNPTGFCFRMRRRLSRLSRGWVDDLRHWRALDPQNNRESTPSQDEHINVLALWAFEMYTPSTIRSLEQGLEKLGWGKVVPFGSTIPDAMTWLERSRGGQSGGWIELGTNLGKIRRPGEHGERIETEPLRAPLPYFAEYAHAHLYSLTPSTTCLAICFVLKDEERIRVEQAMRQTYATFIECAGGAPKFLQPQHQKIRQITSIRLRWRGAAAAWLNKHMPGVLSRDLTGLDLPTCEFAVVEGVEPFSQEEGRANTLLWLADLRHAAHIFDDQTHAGVIFAWDMLSRDRRLRLHSTLVASKASLRALNNSGHYASQEPGWYLHFAVINYEAVFTLWSCSALLDTLEKHMSRLRDVSRTLVASGRRTRVLNNFATS